MSLREMLAKILTDYQQAKTEPLKAHPFASYITGDAKAKVEAALGELLSGLIVEGSPGQGHWAAVPWISVFDPAEKSIG